MKTLVWYVISSAATLISLAVFSDHIVITKVSAGILIMAIVSTVIAISMKESDLRIFRPQKNCKFRL